MAARARSGGALADGALVVEQPRLALDATAESGEVAVGADHPVARHDDRQRVAAVRGADGSGEVAVAEPASLLSVAHSLAIGDRPQRLPRRQLERRPVGSERDVEL